MLYPLKSSAKYSFFSLALSSGLLAASLFPALAAPPVKKTHVLVTKKTATTHKKVMTTTHKKLLVRPHKKTAVTSHKKVMATPKKSVTAKKTTTAKKPTAKKTTYGHVPTPPDSYLQYKVYTVDQLVSQVQDNARIRALYARHFDIPESRVVSYMKANLVESYIPKTGKYKVYCVHRNGKIYAVRQTFRKGTKIFALRNGEPVMKWVCGNPLGTKLPVTKVEPVAEKVGESIESLTPTDLADVFVPSEFAPLGAAPILAGPGILGAAPVFFGGGAGISGLSFLLPLAGGILASTGGGHGGTVPPGGFTPTAVPEPTTPMFLAALTLTAGAGIARRKIVNRKKVNAK